MTKKDRFFRYLDEGLSADQAADRAQIRNRQVKYQYQQEYQTVQAARPEGTFRLTINRYQGWKRTILHFPLPLAEGTRRLIEQACPPDAISRESAHTGVGVWNNGSPMACDALVNSNDPSIHLLVADLMDNKVTSDEANAVLTPEAAPWWWGD